MPILQSDIPERFKLQWQPKTLINMDNSMLGVYERVVTSFEQIAGMFSEVQLALR